MLKNNDNLTWYKTPNIFLSLAWPSSTYKICTIIWIRQNKAYFPKAFLTSPERDKKLHQQFKVPEDISNHSSK